MKSALVPISMLLALPACERAPERPLARVDDAVVTLPAIPGRPGAAYFTLRTNNDPTRLTGIASPQAGRIELHETVREGGVSRMAPLRDTTFSPDAPMRFAPGGRHAMLLDMDPGLRPGDRVRLTFSFDPVPPVTVHAEVRGPGAAVHADH